jgi:hypothetical protein
MPSLLNELIVDQLLDAVYFRRLAGPKKEHVVPIGGKETIVGRWTYASDFELRRELKYDSNAEGSTTQANTTRSKPA